MTNRKAYPSVKKAGFRPRYSKKPKKRQRKTLKMLKPMVEVHTHTRTSTAVMPLANHDTPLYNPSNTGLSFRRNACNVFMPTALTNLSGTEIDGESIYAKYLQMKLRITFPSGVEILVPNQTLYLIHGYVDPTKLTYDDFVHTMSNGTNVASPPKDKIDPSYLPWHVMNMIHEEFNSERDQLDWIGKKQRRGYSILGYNKVTVDKDNAITSRTHLGAVTQGIGVQEGGPPQIIRRITWPMNRKVQYTLSTISSTTDPANYFKYPNDNALPFVCLFNPQWEKQGNALNPRPDAGQGVITVEASSKLWYNDF